MERVRTHYDNLRVARDAPAEVIRAAYRALAQKHHPDINQAPDAEHVMKMLNEAWAVLGDPARRAEHDRWIAEQERESIVVDFSAVRPTPYAHAAPEPAYEPVYEPPPAAPTFERFTRWLAGAGWKLYGALAIASLALLVWLLSPPLDPAWQPQGEWRAPAGEAGPLWSPNGKPWPTHASYLEDKPQQATGGLSKLIIDNVSGTANVHVKLCEAGAQRCDGLRHVFIPFGDSFTLNEIPAGSYELRYRDLTSGQTVKSEPIVLGQVQDEQGARFSVVRVSLYRLTSGNLAFSPVAEEQF